MRLALRQDGFGHVRVAQIGSSKIRAREVGARQFGLLEICTLEVGALEDGTREVGLMQIREAQIRFGEIGALAARQPTMEFRVRLENFCRGACRHGGYS